MNFKASRTMSDQPGFTEVLFEELAQQVEKLPLERYCTRGGWPLKAKIGTIALLENRPERLVAVLYVSFTETGAACCSGDNFEHERFSEINIEIDKTDWSCQFPASD